MKQNNNNHPKVFKRKKISIQFTKKHVVDIDLRYYLLQFGYQNLQYSTKIDQL